MFHLAESSRMASKSFSVSINISFSQKQLHLHCPLSRCLSAAQRDPLRLQLKYSPLVENPDHAASAADVPNFAAAAEAIFI